MKFVRSYFDLIILVFVCTVFLVLGVYLWMATDIKPTLCADDARNVVPCEYTENGETKTRDETICTTVLLGETSCSLAKITAFLTSFGVPLGAAFTWAITFFVGEKIRLSELVFRRDDIRDYIPIKKRTLNKNTVLLIGLGRSGKSELIDQISSRNARLSQDRTNDWAHYGFAIENYTFDNDKKAVAEKTIFVVNDYRGQRVQDLGANITDQIENGGWYKPSLINSVVFIVDLFNWENVGDEDKPHEKIDADRVKFQMSELTSTAISFMFGLTSRDSLTGVYLFINKVDQLTCKKTHAEVSTEAKAAYQRLIDDLEKHASESDVDFACFVGSARLGTKVIGQDSLVSELIKKSERVV